MCGEFFKCSPVPAVVLPTPAGIFGYLNYLVPRTRQYILETLIKGLQRLEYRGYDSAGVAFDGAAVQAGAEKHETL